MSAARFARFTNDESDVAYAGVSGQMERLQLLLKRAEGRFQTIQLALNSAVCLASNDYRLLVVSSGVISFLDISDAMSVASTCKSGNGMKWSLGTQALRSERIPEAMRFNLWCEHLKLADPQASAGLPDDGREYAQLLGHGLSDPSQDPDVTYVMECDVNRTTFDTDIALTEEETRHAQQFVRRILLAYSVLDRAVGYCQGMTCLVATILVQLGFDEVRAFQVFVGLMQVHRLRENFLPDLVGTLRRVKQLDRLMRRHMDDLATRFDLCGIGIGMFASGWMMSLFTNHCGLTRQTVLRILDRFIAEGWSGALKIMLALLEFVRPQILAAKESDVLPIVVTFVKHMSQDDQANIFELARRFEVDLEQLEKEEEE